MIEQTVLKYNDGLNYEHIGGIIGGVSGSIVLIGIIAYCSCQKQGESKITPNDGKHAPLPVNTTELSAVNIDEEGKTPAIVK